MSKSTRPSAHDLVTACRIAHEAAELGEDPIAWRKHLMDQVQLRLLGPDGSNMASVVRQPMTATAMGLQLLVYGDASPAAVVAGFNAYFGGGDLSAAPVTAAFVGMGPRSFVRTREQVCDDGEWYGSWYLNEVLRAIRQDDVCYSQVMVPELGCSHGICIYGGLGVRRFTRRDAAVLHSAHLEIARLWRRGRAVTQARLGPRQWQVLEAVCRGLSAKEAARELGLSTWTVRDHIAELHRRLGVSNRGELVRGGLALQRRRGPVLLPRAAAQLSGSAPSVPTRASR